MYMNQCWGGSYLTPYHVVWTHKTDWCLPHAPNETNMGKGGLWGLSLVAFGGEDASIPLWALGSKCPNEPDEAT